ncbi:MAG: metallophosphoesterase [Candidatus Marinimicrobia bacterium]|nr:metallophosphoesterase [Candidatus Neomarinimicrobiota bacterium]
MIKVLFVSDMHGRIAWYEKLFSAIESEKPKLVLLGGDLLPHALLRSEAHPHFIKDFLHHGFLKLQKALNLNYPKIFLIMGNDDPRILEEDLISAGSNGLWTYLSNKVVPYSGYAFCGYSFVPPTPFQLKDWERYDVSRFVDPGCISPEQGKHSIPTDPDILRYSTIQKDLNTLFASEEASKLVCLFHSPPYQTNLDRAALDGRMVDHAPLDVNIGSIAIRKFIDNTQPLLTLHGHVHESSRITGHWQDTIDQTQMFSAAYEGPQLAVIKFNLENLKQAERLLL